MIWLVVGVFVVSALLLSPYGRKLLAVAVALTVCIGLIGWGVITWGDGRSRAQLAEQVADPSPAISPSPAPLYIKPVGTEPAEPTQDELNRDYRAWEASHKPGVAPQEPTETSDASTSAASAAYIREHPAQ